MRKEQDRKLTSPKAVTVTKDPKERSKKEEPRFTTEEEIAFKS
jgi:hypothetical protein